MTYLVNEIYIESLWQILELVGKIYKTVLGAMFSRKFLHYKNRPFIKFS